jgi:hypothetical protein
MFHVEQIGRRPFDRGRERFEFSTEAGFRAPSGREKQPALKPFRLKIFQVIFRYPSERFPQLCAVVHRQPRYPQALFAL